MKPISPPAFKSKLKPLSIYQLERMSAAQLQRRQALEEAERQQWRDEERPKPAAVTFDDQLAELWAAGATLSDIGLKLGGSRSVVAGRIARARARGDLRFSPRSPGPKKAREQKMKARIVKPPGLFVGARRRESAPQLAAAKPSTLVDLRPGQCHYPVNDPERGGEFLFCAAPVARPGANYCRHHAEIAARVSSSPSAFSPSSHAPSAPG